MQKPQSTSEHTSCNSKNQQTQERRTKNRRKTSCNGYTYLPMVGWYCRREKSRRNGVDNHL